LPPIAQIGLRYVGKVDVGNVSKKFFFFIVFNLGDLT